ncbi:hypothetical protein ACFPYI_14375 [Halomarina salina]|uniref:Uncharacterized protein n=1 Tax=Halomarina salina TaxID=1872699 RepID=A0ABD5RPG4_9EURY|nr:hypothetical protein [Halomarina salina]
MSWLARTSVERPYVLGWVLFCCWLNGWLATGIVNVLGGELPMVLVGRGIPRTLYFNLASLGALAAFVALTYAEVRLLRRVLPRLDSGRDTRRTRRLTAVVGVLALLAVPVVTETLDVDPFTVVVLGVPPVLLVAEGVLVGVVGSAGDGPTPDAG